MGNYTSKKPKLHSIINTLQIQDNARATLNRPQENANKVFLQNIFGMKNVPEEILSKITSLLQKRVYPAGTNVIKQHDVGDRFHFLYDGEVEYIQTIKGKGKISKIHYGVGRPGAYFGNSNT